MLGLLQLSLPDMPASTFLLVLLDQRFAIDPCSPSLLIFMKRVTILESRTPHQPENSSSGY